MQLNDSVLCRSDIFEMTQTSTAALQLTTSQQPPKPPAHQQLATNFFSNFLENIYFFTGISWLPTAAAILVKYFRCICVCRKVLVHM